MKVLIGTSDTVDIRWSELVTNAEMRHSAPRQSMVTETVVAANVTTRDRAKFRWPISKHPSLLFR